jgi:hypothetical protein
MAIAVEFRSSLFYMQPVLWVRQMFPGSCSPPLPVLLTHLVHLQTFALMRLICGLNQHN